MTQRSHTRTTSVPHLFPSYLMLLTQPLIFTLRKQDYPHTKKLDRLLYI